MPCAVVLRVPVRELANTKASGAAFAAEMESILI